MQLNFSQTVINNSKISSGSVRTFCGSSWMTQNLFKKCCCRLCASKNRFSTNSYVSMPDLSLRNVNMIFHRVLFTASIYRYLCHMRPIICEIFICTLSMLSHPDEVWKVHRKSLNYSFNMKILQSFIPVFIENAQKLCSDLSENLGKTLQFDMLTYTSHSALNMICGEWTWLWITSLPCWCRKKEVKRRWEKKSKKNFRWSRT